MQEGYVGMTGLHIETQLRHKWGAFVSWFDSAEIGTKIR